MPNGRAPATPAVFSIGQHAPNVPRVALPRVPPAPTQLKAAQLKSAQIKPARPSAVQPPPAFNVHAAGSQAPQGPASVRARVPLPAQTLQPKLGAGSRLTNGRLHAVPPAAAKVVQRVAAPPHAVGAMAAQGWRQAPNRVIGKPPGLAGGAGVLQRAALPSHLVSSADRPAPSKGLIPEAIAERERERPRDLDTDGQYWHEAIVSNGLLYYKAGLRNGGGLTMVQARLVRSKVIFVLTLDDRLLIRQEPSGIQARGDAFTHANFTGGQDIKAAGQLFVVEGRVIRIDNESGHYRPHGNMLRHVIKKLHREGADLTRALMLINRGDYNFEAMDVHDYILGQKTVLSDQEWQTQEMKFDDYVNNRVKARKHVDHW